MNRLAALALALAAPLAASAAEPAYPINPGYWEATYDWGGLIRTTDRYCVEPKNITTFLAKPCNHIYHCNYPVAGFGNGKAYFKGTITGNNELFHIAGGGTYTPVQFDMHASANGHWKIVPVPGFDVWIKGKFLGAVCPPGAKHFHPRA
jgi:hypothetical protein